MFCGIDVSKNKSQVCILNDAKEIVKEFEVEHTKEGFDKIEASITKDTVIAMETTGNYSKAIYDYFQRRYEVIYVDNGQMHMFAKLHFSHMKNDKIDARLIAKYLSFGLKRVDPIKQDELKDLSRLYFKTSMQLAKYKHMVKGQVNVIFPEVETHFFLTKGKAITTLLMNCPSPQKIAELSDEELLRIMSTGLKNNASIIARNFIPKIKKLASESIGIEDYPVDCFQHTVKIMKFLESQSEEIKAKIKTCIMSSPYNRMLEEFGYSDISLASIVGEIGDIRRFGNYKKFVSYCGFDISEKQSGKSMSKNCYISKRGNKILRHTFYLLVQVHLRYRKEEAIATFFNKLKAKGKHPKQCMTAAARKLAVKCYFDMKRCHE